MTVFVRIKRCAHEPILIGQPAAVLNVDYVPWCEEGNPAGMLLDVMFVTGAKRAFFLSDVELIDEVAIPRNV